MITRKSGRLAPQFDKIYAYFFKPPRLLRLNSLNGIMGFETSYNQIITLFSVLFWQNNYRLTITGLNVKPLEATCSQIINAAKDHEFKVKGPVRIPTKCLKITTRKSPCGEGTNTWDRYEMRIHKRVIDIMCPSSVVKDITTFKIDSSVDVDLIVSRRWAPWFLTYYP